MKTILATAYAVNPWKGSEDGTGWNLALQIARFNKVIVITRKNNRQAIESWLEKHPEDRNTNLNFRYFDLPKWARFWKRGGRGALLYFYLWQFFLPGFIRREKLEFDIAHNLNFHNDWTPTFLGRLNKPLVWGPVGHHPPIPNEFIAGPYGKSARRKNQLNSFAKQVFWKFDPFLQNAYQTADRVICINSSVVKMTAVPPEKTLILPAVASPIIDQSESSNNDKFGVLSIGRFVPLKGMDVTLEAFARFYHSLLEDAKSKVELKLVGKGPEKDRLVQLARKLELGTSVKFIEWMPKADLDQVYRNAKVFLFPSHEGAGMVVPEALSYGLPVLAFDNCGPGELINPSCGYKVPYLSYQASVEAFADKLRFLYDHPDELASLSQNARIFHQEKLTWEAKGPIFQKMYQSISS